MEALLLDRQILIPPGNQEVGNKIKEDSTVLVRLYRTMDGGLGDSPLIRLGNGPFQNVNFDELFKEFEEIFGSRSSESERVSFRRVEVELTVRISFLESLRGTERKLTYDAAEACNDCGGRGTSSSKSCSSCGGRGYVGRYYSPINSFLTVRIEDVAARSVPPSAQLRVLWRSRLS